MSKSNKVNILIIGLITPYNKMVNKQAYFDEFEKLVKTNFIEPVASYFTTLRELDAATFLTKGKLDEVRLLCLEHNIEEVIFSEKLSPNQEMKLEKLLDVTIFDRTHLILEIFEKQAYSEEAKIQVKIAFLEYKKTRVSGRGSHFSQQAGRVGIISGAGETQKELDLQHINHLLVRLRKELKHLEEHQLRQRKERIKNNIFQIAIVGYTNAGKSTIFNMLTGESVLAEDKLFATLSTTTRKLFISDEIKNKVVVTDTVGFIQNIPHELIKSFKSTISELLYASLLLHVVDISNDDWINHFLFVQKTIMELGGENIPMLIIFNKVDLLSDGKISEIISRLKTYIGDKKYIFLNALEKEKTKKLLMMTLVKIINK